MRDRDVGWLPVWVTVLIARIVAGIAIGTLVSASWVWVFFRGSGNPGLDTTHPALPALLGTAALVGVVTGVALVLLLPMLAGMRVGFIEAAVACFAGQMVPTLISLLLIHRELSPVETAFSTIPGAQAGQLLGPFGPMLTIGLWGVGLLTTLWMLGDGGSPTKASNAAYGRYVDRVRADLESRNSSEGE